jgi:hypothetical protein
VTLVPDYCAPITGWRVWLLSGDDDALRLQSVVFQTNWEPGEELRAVCLHRRPRLLPWRRTRQPHSIPSPQCACGIYATSLDLAMRYLEYGRSETSVERVIGLVALWGSVVECERGWRASHAYPSQLFVPVPRAGVRGAEEAEGTAHGLADYGVPVDLIDLPADSELLTVLGRAA